MKKYLYIVLAAALAFSCTREEAQAPATPEGNTLGVTVSGSVPSTKVTLDGESLVWEAADKVALLVGNATSTGDGVSDRSANNSLSASLETVKNESEEAELGVFGGEVELGSFAAADLKALVYPYSAATFYRYDAEGGQIAVPVGGTPDASGNYTMTQSATGVLDGANIALLAEIPEDKLPAVNDGKVSIEGLAFRFACSIIRFNIYGIADTMGPSEVIESITLAPDCDAALAGYQVFSRKDSTWTFSGTARKSVTVALASTEGACPVGKPSSAGVVIYMPVLSRGDITLGTGTTVTIKTNVKSYVLPLAETSITLNPGDIRRVSLNLTDVFPDTAPFKWSADNENWANEAPETFTKLYIKGAINSDALDSIKAHIDLQAAAVALDLSQATYSDETFPALFAGTAEAPYSKLSSIAFPLNVTSVANKAFYYSTALAEASLANISAYGDSAFFATSLTSVRLDQNVTSLGIRTFCNIFTLQEVYFNAADPKLANFSSSEGANQRVDFFTFAWDGDDELRGTHNADLVATIGPDTRLARYAFGSNGNLSKVVFEYNGEGDIRHGNNCFNNCWYLQTVEFKAAPDATHGVPYFDGSTFNNGGKNVAGDKFVVVPEGYGETYLAMTSTNKTSPYYAHGELMRQLVNTHGFKIKDTAGKIFQDVVLYSTDNATWADTVPATFSTLYVKGKLTADNLASIRTAVDAQSAAVALDLSQAEYVSAAFPAVFGSATADEASQKIGSVKFPANVTEIAANAFYNCGALESVSLDGIKKIGGSSFRSTGLRTLTVPASVTEYTGADSFGYNWKLEEVHYYSAAPSTISGTASNMRTLSCRNTAEVEALPEEYSTGLVPLTVYFYEGCVIPTYCFDTNHKLTKVVFKGVPSATGNAWLIRTRYLETIDCRELTSTYTSSNGSNNGQIGVLATGAKQILVPDGKYVNFNAGLWAQLVSDKGFVIVDPLYTEGAAQYSADNSTWSDVIPTTFSTLYIKGNLTADNLESVKTAIAAQSEAVALDMSASSYESEEFPAVFNGATSGNGGSAGAVTITTSGTAVSSIKFPSNITAIAANAFRACDKLTSVDLTGIVTIGGSAFMSSGLVSVTVPASVTTCNNYAFGYCPGLETIYWNAPATNNHAFSWRGAADNENNVASKPQTVTFGEGVNLGTGQCFDTNHKLVKVIFAGDPASVGSGWIIRCTSIHTFDLSACTKAVGNSSSNLGNVGDDVPSGTPKVIIVPDALKDEFAANTTWGYLVNNKGYVIKGVSEL